MISRSLRSTSPSRCVELFADSLLALTLALSGCSLWDLGDPPRRTKLTSHPTLVGFEWDGNTPVVGVFIDGEGPYRFLLDTGAASTLISPRCVAEAQLVTRPERRSIGGLMGVHNDVDVELTLLEELRLGSARFHGVPALVEDLSEFGFDGILGYSVFRDVLLTIDAPSRRVILERGSLPSPEQDPRCLPLLGKATQRFLPQVRGHIGGKRAVLLVDSGFDGALFIPQNHVEPNGLRFTPDTQQTHAVRSRLGVSQVVTGRLESPVEFGALRLEGIPTMTGRGGSILLGGGFLRHWIATFDQRNFRLRLAPPAPGVIRSP